MIKKLIKKIFDTPVDTSRRKFIRNAASLAALTVVATSLPSLLKVKEIQDQIASGVVTGQTFYIDSPVIIDMPNVTISNCRFIATKKMDCMVVVGENAKLTVIRDSVFETNGLVGTCMRFKTKQQPLNNISLSSAVNNYPDLNLTSGSYYKPVV